MNLYIEQHYPERPTSQQTWFRSLAFESSSSQAGGSNMTKARRTSDPKPSVTTAATSSATKTRLPTVACLGIRVHPVPAKTRRECKTPDLIAACEALQVKCKHLFNRIADLLEDIRQARSRGTSSLSPNERSRSAMPFVLTVDVGTTVRRNLTARRRLQAWERTGGRCVLCGCRIDGARERWIVEHIRALELGGADDLSNLGPAHESCACEKTKGDHRQTACAKR
ncbi:hypothetical protein DC522_04970 [Microvirga sp. KLBC 81]|uniref:HNH endonuclease n=1 Tax=Microvirga sp. KLBC 81 TaxID=1862707 RepID=UPI000D52359A|nr:hypothetical protein DC522_04970 [Microvirga sp. KLBC 81]